jgi:hypothetical protein
LARKSAHPGLMERRSFETPWGEIWLWGDASAFDGGGPVTFVIRGFAAEKKDFDSLASCGPIMFAHLPGFYSPPLSQEDLQICIAAFDHVISTHFPDRAVLLVGASVGGAFAAGMSSAAVTAKLLIEPLVSTAERWPLVELLQASLPNANALYRALAWSLLGVSMDTVVVRDYRRHFRPGVPFITIVGSEPLLPRRPTWTLPSLVTPADEAFLLSLGGKIRRVPGGHDVGKSAPDAIRHELLRLRHGQNPAAGDGDPR